MSSKGIKGTTPLVPPWAEQGGDLTITDNETGESSDVSNEDVQKEITEPPTIHPSQSRMTGARRAFGDYAKSLGTKDDLKGALKKYSRAIGGGSGASRRLASAITAGTGLFALLNGSSISNSEGSLSLQDLAGLSSDQAIDKISTFLSPNSADSNQIRSAMNSSLSEALEAYPDFDDVQITPEVLGDVFTCYLTDLVFEQVVLDMGDAWLKAETPLKQIQMENDIRELTKVIVDDALHKVTKGDFSTVTKQNISNVQIQAIKSVIEEWESFNG